MTLRKQARLTKITMEEPDIGEWPNREYAEQEIEIKLRNLAIRKSSWGRWYTRRRINSRGKWEALPIARAMGKIAEGQAVPQNWTHGTIVYVYKNKGGPNECGNYRPICHTQIIYKI